MTQVAKLGLPAALAFANLLPMDLATLEAKQDAAWERLRLARKCFKQAKVELEEAQAVFTGALSGEPITDRRQASYGGTL